MAHYLEMRYNVAAILFIAFRGFSIKKLSIMSNYFLIMTRRNTGSILKAFLNLIVILKILVIFDYLRKELFGKIFNILLGLYWFFF